MKIIEVDIRDKSGMQIIINKEDRYVNLDLLADQINMFVFRELKHL
ncbi:MAG: hypothetical protein ACRCTQ_06455 [Brevinemataceae bacterium]